MAKFFYFFIFAAIILLIPKINLPQIIFNPDTQPISRADIYQQTTIPVYKFQIIETYPHAIDAFTEGLVLYNDILYQSVGLYSHSALQKIDLRTGKIFKAHQLGSRYFGEGISILNNKIYQLTYQSNLGFIYDLNTFKVLGNFHYETEGWGLTNDGQNLIMSNGSSTLFFLDVNTFKINRTVRVHTSKSEIRLINSLAYIQGIIYANIWQTLFIAMINPKNGSIIGWIDMTGIDPDPTLSSNPDVFNGIAYDKKTGCLLVTGKRWPNIYAIKLLMNRNAILT